VTLPVAPVVGVAVSVTLAPEAAVAIEAVFADVSATNSDVVDVVPATTLTLVADEVLVR
jgi:hypothetical protein